MGCVLYVCVFIWRGARFSWGTLRGCDHMRMDFGTTHGLTCCWLLQQRRRESPTVVQQIRVRFRKLSFLDDLPRGPDGRVGPDGMTLSALVTSRFFRHVATCRVFLPPGVVRRVSPTDVRNGWVVAQQQISKTPDRVPGQLVCWVGEVRTRTWHDTHNTRILPGLVSPTIHDSTLPN